jgi:hypothetical protein
MFDRLIDGWLQVLALFGGFLLLVWGLILGMLALIRGLKKHGVDEVQAGPVKIDFETESEKKENEKS